MKKNKSKTLMILAASIIDICHMQAQESLNTSGSNASGTGGSVSYSFGQVIYTTNNGVTGSSEQGVQHPYEIFIEGINDINIDISISIFPNPTDNYLTIQVNDLKNEKLTYILYDLLGKQLDNQPILLQESKINMNNLPSGTYFIYIINAENKKVKSYKVIKTK